MFQSQNRKLLRIFSFVSAALLIGLSFYPNISRAQTDNDSSDMSWLNNSTRSQLSTKISVIGDTRAATFPIPVLVGVTVTNLTKNFNDPRSGGRRTHEGLDMMAPRNTPVATPTKAVVIRLGAGASSGNYISTANPGGERFVYMHLDSIAAGIAPGTVLEAGDIIGYVGNTGNASGGETHLHFEVRSPAGIATDPYSRLDREFTVEERKTSLANAIAKSPNPKILAVLETAQTQISGKINPILSILSGATITEAKTIAAPIATLQFTRDLKLGSQGEDVRQLQIFLNSAGSMIASSGVGSKGNETTYFGAKTTAALAKYQSSQGIKPAAGYFGPITRSIIMKTL